MSTFSPSKVSPVALDDDQALTRSMRRSLRSDAGSIALRLLFIAIVYALLARAITEGMTSPYLLLPLALELLLIFWLGYALAHTVVSCPGFRRSGGSLGVTLLWTVLLGAPMLAALALDREHGELALSQIVPRLGRMSDRMVEFELHWALLTMVVGLLVSTAVDVLQWRREGGEFVWASILHAGFRIAAIVIGLPLLAIPAMLAAGPVMSWLEQQDYLTALSSGLWAWPVWAGLLLIEVAAVALAALVHRMAQRKAMERGLPFR